VSAPAEGRFERRVRLLAIAGGSVAVSALSAGLVLSWAGADASRFLLLAGLCALVIMPVLNVIIALTEEVRRRDWLFAYAALAVLAILIYNAANAFR
jgi:uncharacterized membrane protein